MTDAHTPGPWHFYELPSKPDGLGYIRCEGDSLEISHHGDMGRSREENLANANLTIAAPDLLRLARLLHAVTEYQIRRYEAEGDDEGANMTRFTLHDVNTVIAKATGVQT